MRRYIIAAIGLLCLFSIAVAGESGAAKTKIHGTPVKVKTDDGLELHAWLTASPHGEGPLWVLLPMMGNTHTSYNKFIKELYARFKEPDSTRSLKTLPHILAIDLRGHGESTKLGDKSIAYRNMEPEDFARYPSDVAAVIRKVLADESLNIDRGDIVIIGASIGANTAPMAANLVEGVSKVVMLSPGVDYRSLKPGGDLDKMAARALLLAAAEDKYSAKSVEDLAAIGKERFKSEIFSGPYHGTDLIDNDPAAMKLVLDWLLN